MNIDEQDSEQGQRRASLASDPVDERIEELSQRIASLTEKAVQEKGELDARRERLVWRILNGALGHAEFRALSNAMRRSYARAHGVPESPQEQKKKKTNRAKVKRARKIARTSKRRNRR